VLSRADAGIAAVVCVAAAGGVSALLLPWLVGRLVPRAPVDGEEPAPTPERSGDRRAVLIGGGVAAGSLVAAYVGRQLGGPATDVAAAREGLELPAASKVSAPKGAQLGVGGISSWRTPNDDFYRIDTALRVPQVDPDSWRLRIHGMVEREIELTWRQLLDRPAVRRWVTLACVSNEVGGELAGNALWTGVPLRELLAEARPAPDADAVRSVSADDFVCGTPLSA